MDDVFQLFRDRLELIREYQWSDDNALKIWEEIPGSLNSPIGVRHGEELLDAIARNMVEALTEKSND